MANVASLREVYSRLHDLHGDCEPGSLDRDIAAHIVWSLHDDIDDSGRSQHVRRAIWSAPVTRELIDDIIDDYFDYGGFGEEQVRSRAAEILTDLAGR